MFSVIDLFSEIFALPDLERQVGYSMRQNVSKLNCNILKNADIRRIMTELSKQITKDKLLRVSFKQYEKDIDKTTDDFLKFISRKKEEQKISQVVLSADLEIGHATVERLLTFNPERQEQISVRIGIKMMAALSLTEEEKMQGLMLLLGEAGAFSLLK